MPDIKIEVTATAEALIDELIDVIGLEDDDGEDLSLLAFVKKCRLPTSITLEGEAPEWSLVDALPDSAIREANRELQSGTDELIDVRDFKQGLISLLTGDTLSAEVLFSRAIEDDTLRTQVEDILRQYNRKVAA